MDSAREPIAYEVHYHPPDYPERCFPSLCQHPPQFKMHADLRLVPTKRGGSKIEIGHAVCLGCGKSQEATYGGNVLVDLSMIYEMQGSKHWKIAQRTLHLRQRWSRIATHLFDEKGWNGRHEKVARMIDPNLTMKLTFQPIAGTTTQRMGTIAFDSSYLREVVDA